MAVILVVDDSSYARRVMRKNLEAANHEVLEADGGVAALETYFLKRPDVVLLDLTMEDLGGLEVLSQLRELNPDVRVIVVSADIQSSTEKIVSAAGAASFMGKPAPPSELLAAIDAAMDRSNVQ